MSSRKIVQHALTFLSKKVHLDSLELNANDECYLQFDTKLHVKCSYKEKEKEVILYSQVGIIPKYSPNAYLEILDNNFFWAGTAGSKLILEPINNKEDGLSLIDNIPISILDDNMLYERMEDFVNAIEYWVDKYPKLDLCKKQTEGNDNNCNIE